MGNCIGLLFRHTTKMEHLVATMGGLEAVIHRNQAKIGTEIKTNQEEMKAQVGSLAFQIDAN
jgi:hypothetical protein